MPNSTYLKVRRPSKLPFGVLVDDLELTEPTGYDLVIMRSLTMEGLIVPLVVKPLPHGRFRIVDGRKRLAAIRILIKAESPVYDDLRCIMRPAPRRFALLRCRLQTKAEATQAKGAGGPISPPSGRRSTL